MTMASRKSVTFNSTVDTVDIKSIYDFTPDEISALWYDDDEMDQITKRCFKLLRKMENGSTKYYTRGLEGHTTLGVISKRKNRIAAMAAVLVAQSQHLADGICDDQAMADAYLRTTSSCQMWASVTGKRDQQIADEIYEQNEDHQIIVDTKPTESSMFDLRCRSPEQQTMHKVARLGAFEQLISATAA